ncbi:hypothetical protein B0H16DRAFT_1455706 [Mycena metata]|uniref:Uncharacterized protein n=1 Tax=Mycena metata TaxID=1033252 RepID=A0AAD7NJ82_9AGAR|nr:hypothetical protein B0H16DRAFT_1455706 [Mycena metata]
METSPPAVFFVLRYPNPLLGQEKGYKSCSRVSGRQLEDSVGVNSKTLGVNAAALKYRTSARTLSCIPYTGGCRSIARFGWNFPIAFDLEADRPCRIPYQLNSPEFGVTGDCICQNTYFSLTACRCGDEFVAPPLWNIALNSELGSDRKKESDSGRLHRKLLKF